MAEWLVSPIVSTWAARGDSVLAFVNGMGGTPLIELYVAFDSVARILAARDLDRPLARGNYITSLEMAGFSVTLLRPRRCPRRWWDAPVHTPPCAGASDTPVRAVASLRAARPGDGRPSRGRPPWR
jgi:dihydroxyacetone kinase-like protein